MRSHNRLAAGLLALACILLFAAAGHADSPSWGRTIAAPVQPEAPAWKPHNWYVGAVGGYAWTPDEPNCGQACDDVWHGGVVAGYLWRNAVLGLGVEADYVVRDLTDFAIDDGMASVRGRVGVFAGATFMYATAGIAEATGDIVPDGFRKGLVVGGGVERDVTSNLALRAEVLHYRHADEYTDWGDHGSTAVRAGLVLKF